MNKMGEKMFTITSKQKVALNNMCVYAQKAELGTKIFDLGVALDAGTAYTGNMLLESNIQDLNEIMCKSASDAKLGTLLDKMLKGQVTNNMTAEQIHNLDSMCVPANEIKLGTWLQSAMSESSDIDVMSIATTPANTTEIIIGNSAEINLVWTPSNSTNKEYSLISSAKTKVEVAKINTTKFSIKGLAIGASTITIQALDAPKAPKATINVTVIEQPAPPPEPEEP